MGDYTRDQMLIIVTFIVVNFCNALCASMQAPFFPREAKTKGLKVWHCGLVFGAFELTVFGVSPVIGVFLKRLGIKRTLNIGISVVGIVLVLYGLLGQLQDGEMFLGFALVLRMVEACGNAAFLTGSFSAIAKEFPDNVATMFAVLELFFGIGMIIGPMIGGALYTLGGFTLPFDIMGSLLLLASLFIYIVLPDMGQSPKSQQPSGEPKPSMMNALTKPSILIALYSVLTGAASIGFLQATLEPHLSDAPALGLSSFQVGTLFMVEGGSYGLSLPIWGYLCDAKTKSASKLVMIIGAVLVSVGFLVIGPLPLLPFSKSLETVIVGMGLHGMGLGASVIGGFSDAHKSAIAYGFPDSIDTYGLISGLWTSVFAFGAFLGPVAGGSLYSAITFDWAILLIIAMQGFSLVLLVSYLLFSNSRCCAPKDPYDGLEQTKNSSDRERLTYGSTGEANVSGNGLRSRESPYSRKFCECLPSSVVASSLPRSVTSPGFLTASLASRIGGDCPVAAGGGNIDEKRHLLV